MLFFASWKCATTKKKKGEGNQYAKRGKRYRYELYCDEYAAMTIEQLGRR